MKMKSMITFLIAAFALTGTGNAFAKEKILDSHYTKAWGESGSHSWENTAIGMAETVARNNVREACRLWYEDGTEVVRYAQSWEIVTTECSTESSGLYACKALVRAICYHYE